MVLGSRQRGLFILIAAAASAVMCAHAASAQQVVDKTVAVVREATRTELITYSDVMWELALTPGKPLDPPRSEDLNQVLQRLIDQRIFALEAKRLPRAAPTAKEVAEEIQTT